MGSKMTPSLISEGGASEAPPHGSHRIRYPMGGRVKRLLARKLYPFAPAVRLAIFLLHFILLVYVHVPCVLQAASNHW